eukprot:COSAG02_NODE_2557_length_8529_cov_7.615658_7_plen_242_part_00
MLTSRQGGIRVNAFVSGGLLQTKAPKMVGTKLDGFTHAADWYTTFCSLAGVDSFDHRAALAKLPPVDGLDLWPYLSGAVKTSPRTEVFADSQPFGVLLMEINGHKWKLFEAPAPDTELLVGDGTAATFSFPRGVPPPASHGDVPVACWMGPEYPNGTDNPACNSTVPLGDGLLYDLENDPGEYVNVADQNPDQLKIIKDRLAELQPTFFNPVRGGGDNETRNLAAKTAVERGGFWGPFVFP